MPTIEENRAAWNECYSWHDHGEEWSDAWGSVAMQWFGAWLPRLHAFLPAHSILEIGPGHGRWTEYFLANSGELTLVDLSTSCIQYCQERFKSFSNIRYCHNDGKALEMIPDRSIDLIVSFDSLVHAERDDMEGYLKQFPRILKTDGVAVLHHSNFGEFSADIPSHWRAASMSAKAFEEICRESGLVCIGQETINWGGEHMIDCISCATMPGSAWERENVIVRNSEFMEEARRLHQIAVLYGHRKK